MLSYIRLDVWYIVVGLGIYWFKEVLRERCWRKVLIKRSNCIVLVLREVCCNGELIRGKFFWFLVKIYMREF